MDASPRDASCDRHAVDEQRAATRGGDRAGDGPAETGRGAGDEHGADGAARPGRGREVSPGGVGSVWVTGILPSGQGERPGARRAGYACRAAPARSRRTASSTSSGSSPARQGWPGTGQSRARCPGRGRPGRRAARAARRRARHRTAGTTGANRRRPACRRRRRGARRRCSDATASAPASTPASSGSRCVRPGPALAPATPRDVRGERALLRPAGDDHRDARGGEQAGGASVVRGGRAGPARRRRGAARCTAGRGGASRSRGGGGAPQAAGRRPARSR